MKKSLISQYDLSIVMPVYNEGQLIRETIGKVESSIKYKHELLIIYDMDDLQE